MQKVCGASVLLMCFHDPSLWPKDRDRDAAPAPCTDMGEEGQQDGGWRAGWGKKRVPMVTQVSFASFVVLFCRYSRSLCLIVCVL